MKKFTIYLIIVIIFVLCTFEFMNYKNNSENDVNTNSTTNNTEEIKEKWIDTKNIKMKDNYNYDKDELEAGNLNINDDGILAYLDLKGNVIKSYDYIGKCKSITKITNCSNVIYLVLNNDGILYRTDTNSEILLDEPFYGLSFDNKIEEFRISDNSECNLINIEYLYENEIYNTKLEIN